MLKLATGLLMLATLEGTAAFTAGGAVRPTSAPRFGMEPICMAASPPPSGWDMNAITPDGKLKQRVQGLTRKTWQFSNLEKDRVQVALQSEGRPVKADIELWIGPDWTPFKMKAYSEDGKLRPIRTLVGTRNKAAKIEVRNEGEYEFPFDAASNYATEAMAKIPHEIPMGSEGERVDGGAIRSQNLKPETERLEVVLNTEGRQLNARIELLAGPNNPKQTFEVFTNNGELNSLCVCFNTPDAGNTVRVVNVAPLEFPCFFYCKEI